MVKFNLFKKEEKHEEIDWPDRVVSLDEKNFNDFIKRYPLSVVDFWAPWCGPCRTMLPRLRKLSKMYAGSVAFGRLNTQENQNTSKKYKIMSIPHLIFFSYGKKLGELSGVKSVGEIKVIIEKLLKKV